MWMSYNANPQNNRVGDCTVRAISKATDRLWEETYLGLCLMGFIMHDMPNADSVWGQFLKNNGFRRRMLSCDDGLCTTVREFCEQHPEGMYIVCPQGHVLTVIDGDYYDTWDSGNEIVLYYWQRKDED